jgi:hypothetical protein
MRRELMPNFYEAMLSKMDELGYEDPDSMDPETAEQILAEVDWREREPLDRRRCNLRGMIELLRCRRLPRSRRLYREWLEMLDVLRRLGDWADDLDVQEPEGFAEEMLAAAERCRFEDAMFATTLEFFELVERLEGEQAAA